MFRKKEKEKELNIPKLNEVINLSDKILKIVYIFVIVSAIYLIIILSKELNLKNTIVTMLKIISPLFIGIFIAWLFDPFVKWLQKRKIKRIWGTFIVYVVFIGLISILLYSIIPILTKEVNEFVKTLPSILNITYDWVDKVFVKLSKINNFDAMSVKHGIYKTIEGFGQSLTSDIPSLTIKVAKILFSGAGNILVGLIIGFYLLINFNSAEETIITFLPKNIRDDAKELIRQVNNTCRNFVTGAFFDSLLIFCVSSLAFTLVGLKAPLLFGLFCGITNVIPYAGPYIGGAPAVVVGFAKGPTCGILTLISLVIIQGLEGNFIQPLIMSKTTKLHPVTIMVGLLIFGHFFGILGMVISTPIIGAAKSIVIFFNEKYEIFEDKRIGKEGE